jgi:hypothetical protein
MSDLRDAMSSGNRICLAKRRICLAKHDFTKQKSRSGN